MRALYDFEKEQLKQAVAKLESCVCELHTELERRRDLVRLCERVADCDTYESFQGLQLSIFRELIRFEQGI